MSFSVVTLQLLDGFGTTCLIFFVTLAAALPLGLVVCFGSMSRFRPLRWLTRAFIWVIRGTPLMLQIIIVFYVPGLAFGMPVQSRLAAVLVAFIINYAAYFSEIYRGGIESIPKGQYEAGQVLGMTDRQIFFRVVLLQVIKRIVPHIGERHLFGACDCRWRADSRGAGHCKAICAALAAVLYRCVLSAVQRPADAASARAGKETGLLQGVSYGSAGSM